MSHATHFLHVFVCIDANQSFGFALAILIALLTLFAGRATTARALTVRVVATVTTAAPSLVAGCSVLARAIGPAPALAAGTTVGDVGVARRPATAHAGAVDAAIASSVAAGSPAASAFVTAVARLAGLAGVLGVTFVATLTHAPATAVSRAAVVSAETAVVLVTLHVTFATVARITVAVVITARACVDDARATVTRDVENISELRAVVVTRAARRHNVEPNARTSAAIGLGIAAVTPASAEAAPTVVTGRTGVDALAVAADLPSCAAHATVTAVFDVGGDIDAHPIARRHPTGTPTASVETLGAVGADGSAATTVHRIRRDVDTGLPSRAIVTARGSGRTRPHAAAVALRIARVEAALRSTADLSGWAGGTTWLSRTAAVPGVAGLAAGACLTTVAAVDHALVQVRARRVERPGPVVAADLFVVADLASAQALAVRARQPVRAHFAGLWRTATTGRIATEDVGLAAICGVVVAAREADFTEAASSETASVHRTLVLAVTAVIGMVERLLAPRRVVAVAEPRLAGTRPLHTVLGFVARVATGPAVGPIAVDCDADFVVAAHFVDAT